MFRHKFRNWNVVHFIRSVAAIGCGILLLSGCSLLPKEDQPLQPPLVKPVQAKPETYTVTHGDISKKIEGTASFEPIDISYYSFKQSGGIVKSVNVQSGDEVKPGQVLIQLEQNGTDIDLLQKQVDVEKQKMALLKDKRSGNTDSVHIEELQLRIAELKLQQAQEAYDNKQLVADRGGRVIYVDNLKPGDRIQAFKVLAEVADPAKLRLYYQGNASDLYDVQVGMPVKITVKKQDVQGEVVQTPATAPAVSDQQLADKFRQRIYITLDQLPKSAEIGGYADISITLATRQNTLIIPRRGLRTYLGRNYVQVLDGESRKEFDVKVGLMSETNVEILQGLEEGQQVILN